MRLILPIVVALGCRLHIDDITRDAAPGSNGDVADPTARPLLINVTGRGAVSGIFGICTSQCTFSVSGDATLDTYAAPSWALAPSTLCTGTQCTVPAAIEQIDVTFEQAPRTANLAFITSSPASTTSGRAAFDTQCQTLATQASLSGTFIAFVSTSAEDARDRLTGSRGWVRMDGMPLFDLPTDIGSPGLPRGVLFDETGAARHGESVASGSNEDGTESVANNCADWTTTTQQITNGLASAGGAWMLGGWYGGCPSTALTYCMETGRNVAVDVDGDPFPIGRRLFVSHAKLVGTGASGADTICQTEADAANLAGTFRALLATTTQSAAERIGDLSGPWRRTDDVLVTLGSLDTTALDAGILTDAAAALHAPTVDVGATDMHARALLTENCDDWTTTGTFVRVVSPTMTGLFDESLGGGCGNQSVLCAELP